MKSRIVFDPSTGMVMIAQDMGVIQRAPPKPQGYWDWAYNNDWGRPLGDPTFYASIFQNGLFITVSSNGIWYSTDGGKWMSPQPSVPASSTLYAIASGKRSTDGEEIFVAVGEEAGFYSSDGKTWIAATGLGDADLYDVIYADNLFVAVGSDATILYSVDGDTWTAAPGITGEAQFNAVTWNNVFVAVANSSTIWWSLDGIDWGIATGLSGSANFADVVYGGGKFVAVADYGTIWWSSDGINWSISNTIPPDGPDIYFYKVSYGNGIFVAAGDMGGAVWPSTPIYYSKDGVTWTQAQGIKFDDDYNDYPPFNDLNYVNGYFVAINKSCELVFPMYSSTDGINWNENAASATPRGNGGDGPFDPGGGC
jgi:hypothetical protein